MQDLQGAFSRRSDVNLIGEEKSSQIARHQMKNGVSKEPPAICLERNGKMSLAIQKKN